MLGFGVTESVGAFEHPREGVERGRVQRNHAVLDSFLLRRTCRSFFARSISRLSRS